uniref:Domain of unknown function DB domain-containing protein n=1 Tax=Plectus sambesii TaxID=2011161 RepID=A0A914UI54_9BILA
MLLKSAVCVAVVLLPALIRACEEPKHCAKNEQFCTTREKFRDKCPCTCAADLNLIKCCEHQKFEHAECRDLCTYDPKNELKIKKLSIKCFNDFFKVQYCSSNGHSNSTECCLKHGVTKDSPDNPGCSVFCEVKLPKCSRTFEYLHCARGKQLAIGVKCARDNFDRPKWKANAEVNCAT